MTTLYTVTPMTTTIPKLNMTRNGRTHVALLIAKFLKRPFTVTDLREISNIFDNAKMTSQSLNVLKRRGLLTKKDDKWMITPEGWRFVYLTAVSSKGD